MTYEIRRFDIYGTCYGEVIFRGETKKDCLQYLKDIFSKNAHKKIIRDKNTFEKYTDNNIFHYVVSRG